jgi:hypothetical protein
MVGAAVVFLGVCVVLGAFIVISVRTAQMNPGLVKKIFKYLVIAGVALAFSIAAVAIGFRLDDRNSSSFSRSLKSVSEIWGGEVSQALPSFRTESALEEQFLAEKSQQYQTRTKIVQTSFGMETHAVDINAASNIRQKGLLKFAGYNLSFKGHFVCVNTQSAADTFHFTFPLPSNAGNISELKVQFNGKDYKGDSNLSDGIDWNGRLSPGEKVSFDIAYAAQGTESFSYGKKTAASVYDTANADGKTEIANFAVNFKTDFDDVTLADGSMAPKTNSSDSNGTIMAWTGSSLILNQGIGLTFAISANYGKLFSKIFFYAPLTIALFLAFLLIFTAAKGIRLHPMHYCFITAGFFVFYLLGSYAVTYIHVLAAILLSLAVSSAITWYYARIIGKGKNLEKIIILCLAVFQWFFSAAFFFPEHTGLLITLASIAALVVLMKITAKTEWEDKW